MQAHAVLGLAHMLAHIPVHAGQNVSMIDSLFTGGYLGSQSDIADGSLRNEEFRLKGVGQVVAFLRYMAKGDTARPILTRLGGHACSFTATRKKIEHAWFFSLWLPAKDGSSRVQWLPFACTRVKFELSVSVRIV
eukprot:1161255-Pelagomonas_calceolata.AAC.8